VWPLLVALVAGLVYANTLGNGFALDDLSQVRDHAALGSWPAAIEAFGEPYSTQGGAAAGLYRPVVVASFVVNRMFGGLDPRGYHAANVFLHMLASALVWYVVRGRSTVYGTPLLAGLLFAVHPLHTEAVANVVGRAEILACTFVLVAWLAHRAAKRGAGWVIGAWAAYLLALLSKESVVLAPLVFALDDFVDRGRPRRAELLRWAGYALPFAVAMVLRHHALGGFRGAETVAFIDNPAAFAGTAARIATALWVQVLYLGKLAWPAVLSSDYSFDAMPLVDSLTDPRATAGLLAAMGFGVWVVLAARRRHSLLLAAAAWAVFFFPVSNLPFAIGTVMGERLAYLPLLGGCWAAAHGFALVGERARGVSRAAAILSVAVPLILVAALSARTVSRNPAWSDNETLASLDVAQVPRSAKLHAGFGIARGAAGDTEGAEAAFRRAVEIYPDYAQMRFNLGQLLAARGAEEEAVVHLSRAQELSPGNPRPYKSLAPLLASAGRLEEAAWTYAAGARVDPHDLSFRFQHAGLLLRMGRSADGVEVLAALAQDDPAGPTGRVAAAFTLELTGRSDEAAAAYRALAADSDLPVVMRTQIEARLAAISPP
jgi:Flp pilus assembly protein TadD